jgi:hypothetical protein
MTNGVVIGGAVNFTAVETKVDIPTAMYLVFNPQTDCNISVGDNQHYIKYPAMQAISLVISQGTNAFYVKGDVAGTLYYYTSR